MRTFAVALALLLVASAAGALLAGTAMGQTEEQESDPARLFTVYCNQIRCVFDASNATLEGTEITSYEWEFGDGSTGSGETVNHVYERAGTYNVTLTVEGEDGSTAQETRDLPVSVERDTVDGSIPWIALGAGSIIFVISLALARFVG